MRASTSTSTSGGFELIDDEYTTCSHPSECVVTFPGCCHHCETETVDNMLAIRQDSIEAYRANCGDNLECRGCGRGSNNYLQANCVGNHCTLVNLRETAVVACEDFDCKLRRPGCCECEDSGQFIAIAEDEEAQFARLVCPPDADCPTCDLPLQVSDIEAVCDEGSCEVWAGLVP